MLRFGLEVRGISCRVRLVNFCAGELAGETQAFVNKSRIHFKPALRSMYAEKAIHRRAVGGVATGNNSRRKTHRPGHVFFYLVEASVVIDDGGVWGDVFRLL